MKLIPILGVLLTVILSACAGTSAAPADVQQSSDQQTAPNIVVYRAPT